MHFEMGLFALFIGVSAVVLLLLPKYETKRMLYVQLNDDGGTFRSDFNEYRDRFGLIQNNKGSESGNGLRYTSEYFILGFRRGILQYEKPSFTEIVRSCMVLPGLLRRSPATDSDQQGLDDYVSVTAAACLVDQKVAFDILRYGQKNYYIYNNKEPGKFTLSSWFGRYPGMIAHFHYAAGFDPNFFYRYAWCFSILWCALTEKNNQDGWVLSQRLIEAYSNHGTVTLSQEITIAFFRRRFFKYWPGGMKDLLTQYFGHRHPLATWSIDP